MLGAATAIGLPLALQVLRNRSIGLYYCDYDCVRRCLREGPSRSPARLILLAAVLCCVALWRAGGFKPSRWAPPRLEAITIAVIALWVATAAINLYSIDDTDYGSAVFGHGPARPSCGGFLTAVLVIGLAIAAFRLLTREAGIGALIGVGLLPAIATSTSSRTSRATMRCPRRAAASGSCWSPHSPPSSSSC